ncbi:MAG: hypothetical protein ACXV5Q_17795 [Frankiaceae bacterium]
MSAPYAHLHGDLFLQSLPAYFLSADEPPRRWQVRVLRGGTAGRFAAVATSAEHRRDIFTQLPLLGPDSPQWFSVLAGNPLAPALLVGELGGIYERERVSLHDGALLVSFSLLGGTVFNTDGQRIPRRLRGCRARRGGSVYSTVPRLQECGLCVNCSHAPGRR